MAESRYGQRWIGQVTVGTVIYIRVLATLQ